MYLYPVISAAAGSSDSEVSAQYISPYDAHVVENKKTSRGQEAGSLWHYCLVLNGSKPQTFDRLGAV